MCTVVHFQYITSFHYVYSDFDDVGNEKGRVKAKTVKK